MIRLGRRPLSARPRAGGAWLPSESSLPRAPLDGQVRTFRPDPTTRYERPSARPLDALDSVVMEARDRLTNFGFFAAAAFAWILVAIVLMTRDPRIDTGAGYVGALLIGLAFGLTTVGMNYLPAGVVIALIAVGALSIAAYIRHARRTPAPLLDISLFSLATFRASVLGGFIFRIGVGALPFLLPLLLQLGFNMTPFESGLITFSTALGAMSMKAVVPAVLRQFGFRWTLTVNAILSAAFIAACAGFRPGTPVVVMMAVLVIGGFFRSLEFTSINTIAYAEIDKRRMSRATSLVSVAQQLSMSTGIAVGALAVELTMRFSDHGVISAESFPPAFLLVGALSASAAFVFIGLAPDAGAELANRTPGPTEAADQRMG
jgi:hypothetical protein